MNPIYQISWWCNVVEKYRSVKYHHRYRASEARFEHASFLSDDTCTHPSFMERIVEHNFHHWCWWRWKGLLCVSTNMRGKKPTLIPSIQYARITLRLWMTTAEAFRQILEMGKIVSLGDCPTRVVKRGFFHFFSWKSTPTAANIKVSQNDKEPQGTRKPSWCQNC